MVFTVKTNDEQETRDLAFQLGKLLQPGDVITLSGDLGAGKTTFTKGVAEALEINRTVTSPTFTIIKTYEGKMPLYHIDAYRLENSDEDIGFDEFIYGNGVTIIEWAMFIEEYLPQNVMQIEITFVNEHSREIIFHLDNERNKQLQNILQNKG